jgi:hypothetical protein
MRSFTFLSLFFYSNILHADSMEFSRCSESFDEFQQILSSGPKSGEGNLSELKADTLDFMNLTIDINKNPKDKNCIYLINFFKKLKEGDVPTRVCYDELEQRFSKKRLEIEYKSECKYLLNNLSNKGDINE